MQVINIGTPLLTNSACKVTESGFFSDVTFLDAEMIFWDVESSHKAFPGKAIHKNIAEQANLDILNKYLENRRDEFSEFFKMGRTLIITSPVFHKYEYSIADSTTKRYLDFIQCLEIEKPQYKKVRGQNIEALDEGYINNFLNKNKNLFHYDLKITKSNGNPLMFIKGTSYVVSEYYNVDNGVIIILPKLNNELADQNTSLSFVNSIFQLITGIKKSSTSIKPNIPEWVDNYYLYGEKSENENLSKLRKEHEKIELLISESKEKLSNYNFLKSLFSSDGKTLENAVEFVFKEIGFKITKPNNNRDDLIITINDKTAVVEIKGLTKSAAEKNAAQLQKWASIYHVENEYNPKGILVVNTFKNEKLEQRTNIDFPDQMLPFSNQMKHSLITGLQLLCIYLDFKFNELEVTEIVDILFNTIGVIEYKGNPDEIISLK